MNNRIISKTLLLIISILIIGCSSIKDYNPEPDVALVAFSEETHYRSDIYNRTFKISFLEDKLVNISFLEGLFPEEEMLSISKKIQNEMQRINDYLPPEYSEKKVQIYILEDTMDGSDYIFDHSLYITKDMVADGTYQPYIVQSILNIDEPWIVYGLYSVIFDSSIKTTDLTDFYTMTDDISILGLFGAYFNTEFSTNQENKIAKGTAASLTAFILEKYNFETLIDSCTSALREEWLISIGVNRKFEYPYESNCNNFSFNHSSDYPIIIYTNEASYFLIPLKERLNSVKDVERFIFMDINGRQKIQNYLDDYLNTSNGMIHNDNHLMYYIGDYHMSMSTGTFSGIIKLDNRVDTNLHEAVHTKFRTTKTWANEGFADYMSLVIANDEYYREDIFNFLNETEAMYITENNNISEDDLNLVVMDYYIKLGGNYETQQDINLKLFCNAMAYINLDNEWGGISISQPIYEVYNIPGTERIHGDELTYKQACSFISYLIDLYSIETFLYYCQDKTTFDEAYEQSYEILKLDWINYLESEMLN